MEDKGSSVDSEFHHLSFQDQNLVKSEESTKVDGKRALSYPLRPGRPDCMYLLMTGSCHFKWRCMYNHPVSRTVSQVASKSNNVKQNHPGRIQHPKEKGEKPHPPLLYGAHNYALKSKCGDLNCTAVGRSNLVPEYRSHGPLYSHPWGTPQHAGASMSFSSANPVRSLPSICSSPYSGTLNHSPPAVVTSSLKLNYQIDPTKEADGSTCAQPKIPTEGSTRVQQKIPTEGSVQISCPFPILYGKCQYPSTCTRRHSVSGVPTCALNDVGLPLRPGEEVCTSYKLWGLCKFGPSCKYDHSPRDDPSALSPPS